MKFSPKWQRLTYMPNTGAGEEGEHLTGCAGHIALSRAAAAEGMVLLKNAGNALPLKEGQHIAVFGKAQADYVKGGGGSGDTTVKYVRSILEGLEIKEAEGKLSLFAPLSDYYRENVASQRAEGKNPGFTVEPEVPEALLDEAADFADTAIVTICRFSSEGWDRTGTEFDGDFYLSREERAMVDAVESRFDRVIVVLNIGGMMETQWIKDDAKICAALYAGQGGMEGGLATADILCGDVCPSGHLIDTFAVNFDAYPSSASFNDSDFYVEYNDDIYVGYRYFETIPGAKEKVVYPFGYGLSYTEFEISESKISFDGERFNYSADVKNTGCCAGRQVLQVYASAPQGKLGKAARSLAGFKKTKLLQPGESEKVEISFVPYVFASYDDTGLVKKSAYVLEKGEYCFYAGINVSEAKELDLKWKLDDDRILEQLSEKCPPKKLHKRLNADGSYTEVPVDNSIPEHFFDPTDIPFDGKAPAETTFQPDWCAWRAPDKPLFIDVYKGTLDFEEFYAQLTDEMKVSILGGQPNRGPANTFGFGNVPVLGIPNAMTADGPAGLRIRPEAGVCTTAFPVASLLASSWDEDLIEAVGAAGAAEVYENGIGTWLTPAINIHRTPLCGRNFEYYSEDPLVAGKLSSAMIRGIQSRGVAVSLKHFCCNNKETERRESDSRLSERAMREIYLKAFEICVKEADPWTIMSSYNLINGHRASENKDLLTDVLRGEWGFKGVVTTDWYTHGHQWDEINAGNDIKMGCGTPEATLKALNDGRLSREALDTSVRRVLQLLLKLA